MFLALFGETSLYTTQYTTTTTSTGGLWAFMGAYFFIWLILLVATIVAFWKLFEKAGERPWISLIPFWNTYTLFRIAGRNGWGMLLMFVPIVNIFVWLMVAMDLAKKFGKSTVFGILGLFFFSVVGFLILGFDKSTYLGPKHT